METVTPWRKWYSTLPLALRDELRWIKTPLIALISALIRSASRNRVVAGPFRGASLPLSRDSKRHHLGYVLGTQELELHDVIERIVGKAYSTILNVGAADGYYMIGLALRSPCSRVLAYEAKRSHQAKLARAVRLNNLFGRIELRGRCEPDDLARDLEYATLPVLVLIDIEGGELDVLDFEAAPKLDQADILVETHDAFVPGCTEALLSRFGSTHDVEHFRAQPRKLSDFPDFLRWLTRLTPKSLLQIMDEKREGVQEWLYLTSRARPQSVSPTVSSTKS